MLLPWRYLGFALESKVWVQFSVEYVSEAQWNISGFDALVLEQKIKDRLVSLIDGHNLENRSNPSTISRRHGQKPGFEDDSEITKRGRALCIMLQGR